MEDVVSTTIIPIGIYCFTLGIYFFFLGFNSILDNPTILSGNDSLMWMPVAAYAIFALGFAYVGIGFFHVKRVCWQILFFSLAISVPTTAAVIMAYLIVLWIGFNPLAVFCHIDKITPVMWFSFLGVYLSEIIVMYYLIRPQVVSAFGGMGELISPL